LADGIFLFYKSIFFCKKLEMHWQERTELLIGKEGLILLKKAHFIVVRLGGVDAIDTLTPEVFLKNQALKSGHNIISSMGAGGKTDLSKVQIADISKTYNDKLARYLRKHLHRFGIYDGFQVVFSSEQINPDSFIPVEGEANKKATVGTISYMPALFGVFMASVVIPYLLGIHTDS
jgi:tRNA A37 threonylcarbamoyladenosine dehydratase